MCATGQPHAHGRWPSRRRLRPARATGFAGGRSTAANARYRARGTPPRASPPAAAASSHRAWRAAHCSSLRDACGRARSATRVTRRTRRPPPPRCGAAATSWHPSRVRLRASGGSVRRGARSRWRLPSIGARCGRAGHTSRAAADVQGRRGAVIARARRARVRAPLVACRAGAPTSPSSEVFFVLIHNIIKIRIIHNTRGFPLYCGTLVAELGAPYEGPGAPYG